MNRELPISRVQNTVRDLLIESAYRLPADYLAAMQTARETASAQLPGDVFTMLLDNATYAESEHIPTCQNTGMAILL